MLYTAVIIVRAYPSGSRRPAWRGALLGAGAAASPLRPAPAGLRKRVLTFYLAQGDMHLLEVEKAKRRAAAGRARGADLSTLVREAIRRAYGAR